MRATFVILLACLCVSPLSVAARGRRNYEIWGSDQSNSVADVEGRGLKGSFLWIWRSQDMEKQIRLGQPAVPLGCSPGQSSGPCDLLDVFPQDLVEVDAQGVATGQVLADLPRFGRLHGMIADPQGRYVNANIFAPTGGYVGIIDTQTKEAIALFRVTGTNVGGASDVRSVHMSFWSKDGSAVLIANLNGKLLERINVKRNRSGKITDVALDLSATLGVGKGLQVTADATTFKGHNAFGRDMIGRIEGSYADADLDDLTPAGDCRENGCGNGPDAGRPNNVIICPITSDFENTVYITFGGGGMLVADTTTTPMSIKAEYSNTVVNGAGCGGVQVGGKVWMNAGVSASGAGATQSTFTIYEFDDRAIGRSATPLTPNEPAPVEVYVDDTNTATGGRSQGDASNDSGQLPGVTTRRDSHGMVTTVNGRYMHTVDRIQNVVEAIDTRTFERVRYDLTSADGKGNGEGVCGQFSVSDDANLPINDPAPDLMEASPDGRYIVIAFRGPVPVSVTHSAQGSCPGVGIVEVLEGGRTGKLVTVLRTTNTIDNAPVSAPGGHPYIGQERSDVHGAIVVFRARVEPPRRWRYYAAAFSCGAVVLIGALVVRRRRRNHHLQQQNLAMTRLSTESTAELTGDAQVAEGTEV